MDARLRAALRSWYQGEISDSQIRNLLQRSGGDLELLRIVPSTPFIKFKISMDPGDEDFVFGPWDLADKFKDMALNPNKYGADYINQEMVTYKVPSIIRKLPELVEIFEEIDFEFSSESLDQLDLNFYVYGDDDISCDLTFFCRDKKQARAIVQKFVEGLGMNISSIECEQLNENSVVVWDKKTLESGYIGFYGQLEVANEFLPIVSEQPSGFGVTFNSVPLSDLNNRCLMAIYGATNYDGHTEPPPTNEIVACRLGVVLSQAFAPGRSPPLIADTRIGVTGSRQSSRAAKRSQESPDWIFKATSKQFDQAQQIRQKAHIDELIRYVLQLRLSTGSTHFFIMNHNMNLISDYLHSPHEGGDPIEKLLHGVVNAREIMWFPTWSCAPNRGRADLLDQLNYDLFLELRQGEYEQDFTDY